MTLTLHGSDGVTFPDAVGGAMDGADVAAGKSWVSLQTQTASSSASVNFTTASAFDGTYNTLVFTMTNIVPATNAQTLEMRISVDGGSNYLSGSDYNDGWAGAGQTSSTILGTTGSASSEGACGVVYVFDPTSTAVDKLFLVVGAALDGTAWAQNNRAAYQGTLAAVTAIQFFFASGNIASGVFTMYGISKT
tara:strand:+ start:1184 stop:1759 length:576 start_codon:yes stop_codon:yes gene_type:complete